MTPNPNSLAQTSMDSQPEAPIASYPASLPRWWRADPKYFAALVQKRLQIHLRETKAAKRARSAVAASLLAAVSIYSVDATGAVAIPATSGFLLLFVALALPCVVAWLLDRRLVQQLTDIDLRCQLWLDLVEAVRRNWIEIEMLDSGRGAETEIESFLRKEVGVVAQYLASRQTLAPYLPIFGHCFKLKNA